MSEIVNWHNAYTINPAPIPTLNQWALIGMAALLGLIGFKTIRRRTDPAEGPGE